MEKEIKIEIIGKLILLTILTIVITISILFFIGVSKVNAGSINEGQLQIWDGSTQKTVENCSSFPCQDSYIGTIFNPRYNYDFNSISWGSARFDWTYEITITYAVVGFMEQIIDSIQVGSMQDGTFTDYTNQCRIAGTSGFRDSIHIGIEDIPTMNYILLINCTNIAPPGNQGYQRIRVQLDNGNYIYNRIRIESGTREFREYSTDPTIQAIDHNTNTINNSINSGINKIRDQMIQQWEDFKNNNTWNNIQTPDLGSWINTIPGTSGITGTEGKENQLMQGVSDGTELDGMAINIDADTSSLIWNSFTEVVTSNQIIYSTILTLLLLGVIKLALAR